MRQVDKYLPFDDRAECSSDLHPVLLAEAHKLIPFFHQRRLSGDNVNYIKVNHAAGRFYRDKTIVAVKQFAHPLGPFVAGLVEAEKDLSLNGTSIGQGKQYLTAVFDNFLFIHNSSQPS